MKNVSGRERNLLIACGVVAIVSVMFFWKAMSGGEEDAKDTITREQLNEEKRKHRQFIKVLREEPMILKRQEEISNYLPSGKSVEESRDMLNQKINSILKTYNEAAPNIQPPRPRPIKDVDKYKFLMYATKFNGPYDQTCKLLDAFDRHGFFIEDLKLQNTLDRDWISVTVTLSKLVKLSDVELERQRRLDARHGRRDSIRQGGA